MLNVLVKFTHIRPESVTATVRVLEPKRKTIWFRRYRVPVQPGWTFSGVQDQVEREFFSRHRLGRCAVRQGGLPLGG